jgi:hypothetical protein
MIIILWEKELEREKKTKNMEISEHCRVLTFCLISRFCADWVKQKTESDKTLYPPYTPRVFETLQSVLRRTNVRKVMKLDWREGFNPKAS